jgi:prepilin-type N-terminal cleavage/methylation domain-containing protein
MHKPNQASTGVHRRLPQPQADGFTLIELMIVVAIVGLASSLVALSIRDPSGRSL